MADYDSPWKEVLDPYFEPFMGFFFYEAHAEIDWARGYELLDKELQQITGDAELGRRTVDKLVKVWLQNGEERWLLIHVEVQTWKEADFPKRMYVYNYRVFDRYNKEVVSLAVLADDDASWRPNEFGYRRWGFSTNIRFPVVKLLDYAARWEELEKEPNPFAVVVLAHLKTLETQENGEERRNWKLRLAKGLYERGLSAEKVRGLFRFIDWIMELPKPLEQSFWNELHEYAREKNMSYITTPERIGMEKARLEDIEWILEARFGARGLELMPEIRKFEDAEKLKPVVSALGAAANVDEFALRIRELRRTEAS